VTYALTEEPETRGTLLTVTVEANGRTADIAALITLPEGEAPEGGWPFFLEYAPWHYQDWSTRAWVTAVSANCRYAASRGYAGVQYDPSLAASDNSFRTGAFFRLYPYYEKGNPDAPRGVLLAWAWGVSKILDALEAGAGEELHINPSLSLVGGVSRWGKSAAVAGAYDERIRVTIPSCSGLGGTAVFRTDNSGKTYDLSGLGGPSAWVNESINEPFANLKGGEGYWFCGNFAAIASAEHLPVDQHMLCALAAGPDRHLIMVTGITSEGWNNTEGQCLAWRASQPVWDLLGVGEHNNLLIHLDGHAILPSDMEVVLD
jgi:endo-1,4-beta-xylanase